MSLQTACSEVMVDQVCHMKQLFYYKMWRKMNFGPTAISNEFFQWIPRDFNTEADSLAGVGAFVGNRILRNVGIRSAGFL